MNSSLTYASISPWIGPVRIRSILASIALGLAAIACCTCAARAAERPFPRHQPINVDALPSTNVDRYLYVSPLPGSRMVSPRNNVIVRYADRIDPRTVDGAPFAVIGARTGLHTGNLALSDDGRTLVFEPAQPFVSGERVTVRLEGGVLTLAGEALPALEFGFTTGGIVATPEWQRRTFAALDEVPSPERVAAWSEGATIAASTLADSTLPEGYPDITLLASKDCPPGYVYVSPFTSVPPGHLMILDNAGQPIFYRRLPHRGYDFKRHEDGRLSYFMDEQWKHYVLDGTGALLDSMTTGNGYVTDLHDLLLLPEGHAMVMAYDRQPMRMDTIVAGGRADATVMGLIVQELDAQKRVVFQWRSWDWIPITDCASPLCGFTDSLVDYVHGNAFAIAPDGNILLSLRHLNEITKIDRITGAIHWRMGLNAKNNEFTFVSDPRGFSHQHDIRVLPNGHITVFDNGNYQVPQYSRGLEYDLDEGNHIVDLAWEYHTIPSVYGGFMGNVQRNEDGSSMIGWGGTFIGQRLTEVLKDGSKSYELGFPAFTWTYRAFRDPWQLFPLKPDIDSIDFGVVNYGEEAYRTFWVRNLGREDITLNGVFSTDSTMIMELGEPVTLGQNEEAPFGVEFRPPTPGAWSGTVYVRAITPTEVFACPVQVRGIGGPTASVGPVAGPGYRLALPRPNPFRGSATFRFELPRREHVTLDVFDLQGRRVATVAEGTIDAGPHEVSWRPAGHESGLFFYRFQAGSFERTGRLIRIQ